MAHVSELIASNISEYLKGHETKGLLRFITCGSVDDGKSTLIGRLLHESRMIYEDQLAAITADSRKWGTRGGEIDFALLVDGLAAEREQGITIDVAYRFFSTDRRKFIVADTPGHEQYTRNMVTGASTADLAVVMVDARKGVVTQTCRHSYIASLLGIRHFLVVVNKMDLVNYDEAVFQRIRQDFQLFAQRLALENVAFMPVSAVNGDNVSEPSTHMRWYTGPALMPYLETVEVRASREESGPFRMPVQWVNRPSHEFRGFAGTIAAGRIAPGDQVRALPSGKQSRVARIATFDGDLVEAVAGQSVTLTLADEIDVSRGDLLCQADSPASLADQFEATIVWMHEDPLMPGRPYLLKIGAATVNASVTDIKYQVNVNTLEHVAAKKLELNAIGVCNISLDRAIAFDAYTENRDTGGFILIDRTANHTAGAGMLHFALRRSQNIHPQHLDVNKSARAAIKGQKPCVLWLTGLSGAGKSTIANLVERQLHGMGRHTYLLDGDNVRHGLNRDLGFTDEARVENIRRVAEVARLMADAGLIVITAFISPFRAERRLARSLMGEGEFMEVFVDAPLAVAEQRDPKGLFRKARRGELKNFTGIDSPYEVPEHPELTLRTDVTSAPAAASQLIELLEAHGFLRS